MVLPGEGNLRRTIPTGRSWASGFWVSSLFSVGLAGVCAGRMPAQAEIRIARMSVWRMLAFPVWRLPQETMPMHGLCQFFGGIRV